MVVPLGTSLSSISRRTKSKSVLDAAGNPTSISGTPSASSSAKNLRLRSLSIGLTSAWLPSRRSVEHQIGAASRTRSGQVRSGRSTVAYGRYFQCGMGIAQRSSSRRWTHQGCEQERICRRVLPLAGKEEREADQRAVSGEDCATRAGHGGHDNRPSGAPPDPRARRRVVGVGRTDYPLPLVSGAVTAVIALAAASRKAAIFGFGPPS